jgi:hypothetical protein
MGAQMSPAEKAVKKVSETVVREAENCESEVFKAAQKERSGTAPVVPAAEKLAECSPESIMAAVNKKLQEALPTSTPPAK